MAFTMTAMASGPPAGTRAIATTAKSKPLQASLKKATRHMSSRGGDSRSKDSLEGRVREQHPFPVGEEVIVPHGHVFQKAGKFASKLPFLRTVLKILST